MGGAASGDGLPLPQHEREVEPPERDDGDELGETARAGARRPRCPAPDRIAAAYREGYEHVRFVRDPYAAGPVSGGPCPALARAEAAEDASDGPTERRPAPTTLPGVARTQIADAARAHTMREAHASARLMHTAFPREPYRACLSAALREVHARPRRCPLPALREQAAAWAECAAAAGARFDVARKAASALAFSADNDLASLAVPSKLTGTAPHQDAAGVVGSRLDSRGGWVLTERDGSTVYALGLRLGDVQPKHSGWLAALGPVRLAVIAVTGGDPYVTPGGDVGRKTRGVNVAFEVGAAALDWRAAQAEPTPAGPTAAEMQAMLADLF